MNKSQKVTSPVLLVNLSGPVQKEEMKEFGPLLFFLDSIKKKIKAPECKGLIGHKAAACKSFQVIFLLVFAVKQLSFIVTM